MPNNCCEKCHDVTYDKTYPGHTSYHACLNLKCKCHVQEPSQEWDWEKQFDDTFPVWSNQYLIADGKTAQDVKDFIAKLLQSQENDFKKILNSGKRMYEIGTREEKTRIIGIMKRKRNPIASFSDRNLKFSDGYNKALDDILSKLEK